MDLTDFAIWHHATAEFRDDLLRRIADADYGEHFDEHLAALKQIAVAGVVPAPLPWEPKEVLQLSHYAGEHATTRDGRLIVLFCCLVLQGAQCDPESEVAYPDSAVLFAIHSVEQLDPRWRRDLREFLDRTYQSLLQLRSEEGWLPDPSRRMAHLLGGLILASLDGSPPAERGRWRRRLLDEFARCAAFEQEMGGEARDPWEFMQYETHWRLWRTYLEATRADTIGFAPSWAHSR